MHPTYLHLIGITLFWVSALCASTPPYFLQTDPQWASEYLGISGKTMQQYGDAVCSIAMALQGQGLLINGQLATPLSLNNYLKLWQWNGETDGNLWSIISHLGLSYSPTIYNPDLSTIRNYLAMTGFVVFIRFFSSSAYYSYYYSDGTGEIVGLAIDTFADKVLVQNPIYQDPSEVMITTSNIIAIYTFQRSEQHNGYPPCSPQGCDSDPCSCDIFNCPFRRQEDTTSCELYELFVPGTCDTDTTYYTLEGWTSFLSKCAIKSCSCPYFYLENSQSCTTLGRKRRVFIGAGIPVDTYSSQLSANGNLGIAKLEQIESYSNILDLDLLGQMFLSNTGLNTYEEDEINAQYYRIISNFLAGENLMTFIYGMPFQVLSIAFYAQNIMDTTKLTSSKLWKAVKEMEWKKVLKAVSGKVPYEDLKYPKLMDSLITGYFSCEYDKPFADVLILRNTNYPDYYQISSYNNVISSLISGLEILESNIRVGLASFGYGFTAHTNGFLSNKGDLQQQFNYQMASNYYCCQYGDISQALYSASTFFSNYPRTSNGGRYPKIIVLFTSSGSGSLSSAEVENYLKLQDIQIIIFTTSTSTNELDLLKTYTSNNAAYSTSYISLGDLTSIVNNYARSYTLQPDFSAESQAQLQLFKYQKSYIKVPIPVGGVTVRVIGPLAISTVKGFASSIIKNPNHQMYDSVGLIQNGALTFSQNSQVTGRILASGSDSQDFLYIGFYTDYSQTLTIQVLNGISFPSPCPENCETCDFLGATCTVCKAGYELYIDTCETTMGMFIMKNNKIIGINVDYQGMNNAIMITGAIIAGILIVMHATLLFSQDNSYYGTAVKDPQVVVHNSAPAMQPEEEEATKNPQPAVINFAPVMQPEQVPPKPEPKETDIVLDNKMNSLQRRQGRYKNYGDQRPNEDQPKREEDSQKNNSSRQEFNVQSINQMDLEKAMEEADKLERIQKPEENKIEINEEDKGRRRKRSDGGAREKKIDLEQIRANVRQKMADIMLNFEGKKEPEVEISVDLEIREENKSFEEDQDKPMALPMAMNERLKTRPKRRLNYELKIEEQKDLKNIEDKKDEEQEKKIK